MTTKGTNCYPKGTEKLFPLWDKCLSFGAKYVEM